MRIVPSTTPSTTTFSAPVISPLNCVLAPITQGDPPAGGGDPRRAAVEGAGTAARGALCPGLSSVLPKIPMPSSPVDPLAGAGEGRLERATGFEPATPSLGSSYSTN